MADETQRESHDAPQPKKPFEPPRLVVYGDIATLTRAVGRTGLVDGGKGNTTRRPAHDRGRVRYSIYGLTLDVSSPLSGFIPAPDHSTIDVVLRLRAGTPPLRSAARINSELGYESEWLDDETGTPGLTIYQSARDGTFTIRYADGLEFEIDEAGHTVSGTYPPHLTLADVANRITGPVFGFLLRLRGVVALHASVVEIAGGAVAFVGDARAGKSTIAAMFVSKGLRVVTEDVAALIETDSGLAVCSGCAEIALRPDAATRLYGSPDALPRFSDAWDKRRLDLASLGASTSTAVPLRAVYILTNTPGVPDAPCVASMSASAAIVELLANVYGNRLFHSRLRARELEIVHRIASTVPVRVAATGAKPELLERFCEVLLDDLHSC